MKVLQNLCILEFDRLLVLWTQQITEAFIEMIWRLKSAILTELNVLRATYLRDSQARMAIRLFFLVTMALIAFAMFIDVARYFDFRPIKTREFSLTRDRGIPELYSYFQTLVCATFLALSYRKYAWRAFLFLTLLYAFIFVDDAFSYHEEFGEFLVEKWNLHGFFGMRNEDSGELLAWSIAAIILIPPLLWCLLTVRKEEAGVYLTYAVVFCGLVFFAVLVDMVHAASQTVIPEGSALHNMVGRVLAWIEDGGEMVMIWAAAACAILYYRSDSLLPTAVGQKKTGA